MSEPEIERHDVMPKEAREAIEKALEGFVGGPANLGYVEAKLRTSIQERLNKEVDAAVDAMEFSHKGNLIVAANAYTAILIAAATMGEYRLPRPHEVVDSRWQGIRGFYEWHGEHNVSVSFILPKAVEHIEIKYKKEWDKAGGKK